MALPEVELRSTQYHSDGSYHSVETHITDLENSAVDMCIQLGREALLAGDPPIGAVVLDYKSGRLGGARTIDKTVPKLMRHAEIRAYFQMEDIVGDQLQDCGLVSSAQPCTTCTPPYAEGKIGKIIYAAPRRAIYEVAGIMRPRKINLHDLMVDGQTETIVTEGYRAEEVLGMFVMWAERNGGVKRPHKAKPAKVS